MNLLEDDGTGGRFRVPATVMASLREGLQGPGPEDALARAREILAEGYATPQMVAGLAVAHARGSQAAVYGGTAGVRWVARLQEEERLEERFGDGLLTSKMRSDLADRADRRRRDTKGQFRDEISKLAVGQAMQIGNVEVTRRRSGHPSGKYAVRDLKLRTTELYTGKGGAIRIAQDASANDDHPRSVGGKTRFKDRRDAALKTGQPKEEPVQSLVNSGKPIDHDDLEKRGLAIVGPIGERFRKNAKRLENGGERVPGQRRTLDSQQLYKPGGKMVTQPNGDEEYVGGEWNWDRKVLHRTITARLLQGVSGGQEDPKILLMAGGGASGKTTALRAGAADKPSNSVLINPDVIKNMLSEYDALIDLGDKGAAGAVHEESSEIAKAVMAKAIELRMNITVDKTQIKPKEVDVAKGANYSVSAMVATTPIVVAQDRAVARGKKPKSEGGGRFVDPQVLEKAHRDVAKNFPEWAKLGIPIVVQDTHSKKRLAEVRGGELRILDKKGYALFLSRATQSDH